MHNLYEVILEAFCGGVGGLFEGKQGGHLFKHYLELTLRPCLPVSPCRVTHSTQAKDWTMDGLAFGPWQPMIY